MKKLFTSFLIICLIAIYINIIVSPITVVASEDTDDRNWPMYSLQQVNEGILGNDVVFNSINIVDSDYTWHKNTYGEEITKGVITNESNFVGARENTGINAGANNVWNGDRIKVEEGKSYIVRLYVHNNNPNGEQAIAENTRVSFNIPSTSAREVAVNGYIYSDSASVNGYPYMDNVIFESATGESFHLEYVKGSALLENQADYNTVTTADGKKQVIGFKLSDDIVEAASIQGVKIGYKLGADGQPNGQVPGCYQYDSYVTIEVKAVFDYVYTIETLARIQGEAEWQKTVEAKVGDKVEFQIQYENTSDFTQEIVAIKNILPDNLRIVPGSTKFMHVVDGKTVVDSYPGEKITQDGLAIGSFTAGSNGYIMFTAEIVDDSLGYGSNTLANWAQVGVGEKVIQDYAMVIVYNDQNFQSIIFLICVLLAMCLLIGIILVCRIRYLKYLASKIDKDKS